MKGLSWLMQLLTGLALIFLVSYHFIVTHITGSLEMDEVIVRFHELRLFYAVLLIIVAYHAFNGLRVIAVEYGLKKLGNAFYVLLLIVIVYGLFLLSTV